MAISQSQIVDLLFKQAFGVTKTDIPSVKSPSNESIPSPLLIRGDTMWSQSGSIPTIAAAVSDLIQAYTGAQAVQCVADTTTVPISGVYPTWKTNLTYWIPAEFGATYAVKVYVDVPGAANPTVTGTQIFAAGAGGIGEFYFNYQSGVLNFIGETIPPSLTSSRVIYIVGYRYIGLIGANNQPSLNIQGPVNLGNVANVTILGGSSGQYLQTDGTGNLTWAAAGGGTLPIANTTTLGGIRVGSTLTIDESTGVLNVDNTQFLQTSGGTLSGNLIFSNGATVTGLPTPINESDAATKRYVDDAISGLNWKQAVVSMSTTNIDIATPTTSIGGTTVAAGDRVLLIGQTTTSENGIYLFNGAGVPLTRTTDANQPTELNGAAVYVQYGTNQGLTYTQTATLTGSFAGQNWVQFGSSTIYNAGAGLELSGTTFNVLEGQGLLINGSNQLELDIDANSAIKFSGEQQLTLLLEGGGGLEQSSNGLRIAARGVTNAMLANSGFLYVADSGNNANVSLGQSVRFQGNSTQGVATSLSTSGDQATISISVANANNTQRGVASFNSNNFTVIDGQVSLLSSGTPVSAGGTGRTYLEPNMILYGNGSDPIGQSSTFTYDPATKLLTVGGSKPMTFNGDTATISVNEANGNLRLLPNNQGSIIFGQIGNARLETDAGGSLGLKANSAQVSIESGLGNIILRIGDGTNTSKVRVTGVSPGDYANNLGANDLVNKQFVTDNFLVVGGGTYTGYTPPTSF